MSGRCVLPQDAGAVSSLATFSLSSSDCLEVNMKPDSNGVCVCLDGYKKNATGQCSQICKKT